MEKSLICKECIICLEEVYPENNNFVHCVTCQNFYHEDCYNHWKSQSKDKKCPYCQQKTLFLYKFYQPMFCCIPLKKKSYHILKNI